MTASSGYITMPKPDNIPIFAKQKMKLQIPSDIISVRVSNNWLVCLMSNNVAFRLYLLNPTTTVSEVELDKYMGGYNIGKTFLDPTGFHYFVTLDPKTQGLPHEFIYIYFDGNIIKPKKLDKFRDHEITSIGFNYKMGTKTSTGNVLLGTSKGIIFECEFTPDCAMIPYRKQLFDLSNEKCGPITSINFFRIPNSTTFIVLVATPNRLYKFYETVGPADKMSLQAVFNSYKSGELFGNYEESEKPLKNSSLGFISEDNDMDYPAGVCWLNGSGVFNAHLNQTTEFVDFLIDKELLNLPNYQEIENSTSPHRRLYTPRSFALTKFHVLLLYSEKVTAISLLNQEKIIYEEQISMDNHGKLLDIIRDDKSGAIYIYTTKLIFRYRIHDEQRDVWKMYLEKSEYDLAEKYASNNLEYLDIIRGKKAESLFEQKKYLECAEIYSKTMLTFEEICLKFLALEDKKPLILYLQNRLEKLKDQDSTQITMLVIWLIELFLVELSKSSPENARTWQQNFDYFLQTPRVANCIINNRNVVYDLMGAHGDSHNMTKLAAIYRDYEKVINENISQRKFIQSLAILKKQNNPDLFYKYCPILMEAIPEDTISTLISQGKRLNPDKLIPTLICLQSNNHIDEVIKYLEFAIYNLSNEKVAFHNFLLKLYAQTSHDKLMKYLEAQGRDESMVRYDIKYALRVCEEHQAKEACIFLLCLLKMWEPAVEMALNFNIDLAKDTARQPSDDDVKRRLWLKIAQSQIKGTDDVKKALDLLKESSFLKIEDLLPYFSDFEKIDDFKEAICDALKDYNTKIQDLQSNMEENTQNADRAKKDLRILKSKAVRISPNDKCYSCTEILLIKSFIIFPCGHKFHTECVEKQIITNLSSEESRNYTSLKQQLEMSVSQAQTTPQTASVLAAREKIKYQIESILASNCLFCYGLIENLDSSFINEKDWDQAKVDWE